MLPPIQNSHVRDPILGLQVMDRVDDNAPDAEKVVVIGIPAVRPVRHYMVDVDGVGLVWVDWNVHYL